MWHIVKLPIFQIKLKPMFVKGAKTKMYDEKGNVTFDGEKQMTTSGIFVHASNLPEARRLIIKNGLHEADGDPIQLQTELPLLCPICDKKGTPVVKVNPRRINKVLKKEPPSIYIRYYHSKGSTPHYIGRFIGSMIYPSKRISDTRKLHPRWRMPKIA
ncbi:MAG: hypothetical protein KGH87_01120 [Thaumarchaeota archaeon]|nr:hypothetical protein [Nitrososphaerota archaeon]